MDEVLSETPQQLVDRTSALIEVAAEGWIVTGRHPLPLLMAAVYVAWQSLNPKVRCLASAKWGECSTPWVSKSNERFVHWINLWKNMCLRLFHRHFKQPFHNSESTMIVK